MAQLYKVHGGERAFCPFPGTFCDSGCSWLVPYFRKDGEIESYTCCMNNTVCAALMTEEQLERYKKTKRASVEIGGE